MVAKGDILEAAKVIEAALTKLTLHKVSTKVHVFETDYGRLKALIGDGGFRDMLPMERLTTVLEYLRENVSEEHLSYLIAVFPMDLDEYDRSVHEA